jgi:hypothetical protein
MTLCGAYKHFQDITAMTQNALGIVTNPREAIKITLNFSMPGFFGVLKWLTFRI